MKVLLTGSSSLLGAQVVRQLVQRGDTVRVMQRRPSDVAEELGLEQHLGEVVDETVATAAVAGVDTVIHLAARVGVVGTRKQFFDTNVVGSRTPVQHLPDRAPRPPIPGTRRGSTPSPRRWRRRRSSPPTGRASPQSPCGRTWCGVPVTHS